MSLLLDAASWTLIVAGVAFCLVGALGLIRMPDLYTRMHASGVMDPFGVCLLLLGLALQAGFTLVTVKLGMLALLLLFTSPVACHALGRAAWHRGVKPQLGLREDGPSKP